MKRAWLYFRLSRDEDQEMNSLQNQRQILVDYANKLEQATIQTIEDGVMTGDLYLLSKLENKKKVNSKEFLEEIGKRLSAAL